MLVRSYACGDFLAGEMRHDPFLAEMKETADNEVLFIRSPQHVPSEAQSAKRRDGSR